MRKVGFSILPQRWYIELFFVGMYLAIYLPIHGVVSLYYIGSTTTHTEYNSLYDNNTSRSPDAITDQIGDYAYISFNREEGDSPSPLVTSLRQNYPNPFNPSTTISFVLGTESEANLDIFNARGQLIRSFRYDRLARGLHSLDWDGKDNTGRVVSSGLYFYRLQTPEKSLVNKMLLLK